MTGKGWLHKFRNKFRLKNIKITAEAASANKEVAVTFAAELKKLLEVWYYSWFQATTGGLETYPLCIRGRGTTVIQIYARKKYF